jgi:hypothetical protein
LQWTATAQEAFQQAKCLLAAALPIQHPAPNAELSLATDASDTHIGGVMQQKSGDHWQPLGFFSPKLTDTESRCSTFDCELLAAQAAIKNFRHFCKGRVFQLWTNHKPLVTALSRVSIPISPRQQCQLSFISEFNVQLLYLPGLKNDVANFLSHPPPTDHQISHRHNGGRSGRLQRDGRRDFQQHHLLGQQVSGLPAGQDPPSHTSGPPAHPHPAATFFSPSC